MFVAGGQASFIQVFPRLLLRGDSFHLFLPLPRWMSSLGPRGLLRGSTCLDSLTFREREVTSQKSLVQDPALPLARMGSQRGRRFAKSGFNSYYFVAGSPEAGYLSSLSLFPYL